MYIPPLHVLLNNLGLSLEEFKGSGSISVPASLVRFLLQVALTAGDFNEEGYLAANTDVMLAVNDGTIKNPHLHYIGDGYFESRLGGSPAVDEQWYLTRFPDVADAVARGSIKSATAHFDSVGAIEFRAPSEEYQVDAIQWGRAFGRLPPEEGP